MLLRFDKITTLFNCLHLHKSWKSNVESSSYPGPSSPHPLNPTQPILSFCNRGSFPNWNYQNGFDDISSSNSETCRVSIYIILQFCFCFNHALSLHNVSKFCFALQFVLWMMCVELLRFTLDGFLITHNDNDAVWTSFFLSFFCGNLVLVSWQASFHP